MDRRDGRDDTVGGTEEIGGTDKRVYGGQNGSDESRAVEGPD